MRREYASRRGQRLPKVCLSDLPSTPPRRPGERPRTFAPLPPPVCIWSLPAHEQAATAHLGRLFAPQPSIAWRIARGALLFFCAFALTCLTLLAFNWLDHPAPVTAQRQTAPASGLPGEARRLIH